MGGQSRRQFLQRTAAAAAASALTRGRLWAAGARPGAVKAWTTAPGRLYQATDAPQWKPWAAASPLGIDLDPSRRYQELLGFGGAFTDSSCYLFNRMQASARQALLKQLFTADGIGLTVGRTCIGSSDYSRNAYTFDDASAPDGELTHFSIDHDRAYILPTLQQAGSVCPELFLFSSPWSPPAWMKDNGSLMGGSMVDTYFHAYASYFAKFVQGYADAGVKVRAVTVQNESDTNQNGKMPQCEWGQQYEIQFVGKHLGPLFEKLALDTKIWILDHNYDLWGRVLDEFSDALVYKYADGVAWHGYVGTPDAMTRVHNAFPTKSAYWTEGGPDYEQPDYATDWAKWSSSFTGIIRNWARTITTWNLLLDEKGQPDIGPFHCGGLVTVNSQTGALSYSGQYHAYAHYGKSMRRGAVVFASSGDLPGVDHVAAENPDGSRVLVLTNREAAPVRVQCRLGGDALELPLAGDSVTTLTW